MNVVQQSDTALTQRAVVSQHEPKISEIFLVFFFFWGGGGGGGGASPHDFTARARVQEDVVCRCDINVQCWAMTPWARQVHARAAWPVQPVTSCMFLTPGDLPSTYYW